jgi:hypothetical protein
LLLFMQRLDRHIYFAGPATVVLVTGSVTPLNLFYRCVPGGHDRHWGFPMLARPRRLLALSISINVPGL